MHFNAHCRQMTDLKNLQVSGDVLGSHHSFVFEGMECAVSLPSEDKFTGDPLGIVRREQWTGEGETSSPTTWFGIYSVLIVFAIPGPIQFDGDESEFRSQKVADSDWAAKARETYPSALQRLREHWLGVVCWIARDWRVCFDDNPLRAPLVSDGYTVCRTADNRVFDAWGGVVKFQKPTKLSRNLWEAVGEALASGEPPPLWFEFAIEARRKLQTGDVAGAITSAAVACETVMRAVYALGMPELPNSVAARAIEGVAVQAILDRWIDIAGVSASAARAAGKSSIHKLFDFRNNVMHRGERKVASADELQSLMDFAWRFIEHADEVYRKRKGLPLHGVEPLASSEEH